MRAVERVAVRLLRLASRRWPADLRELMLAEWLAELAVISADRTRRPVARAVRQLRYAISLAGSPPVGDEYGVPRGWREMLPGLGQAVQPVLMLLGAAVFCSLLVGLVGGLGNWVLEMIRGYRIPSDEFDWVCGATSVASLAIATVAAALIGGWLGRRLPIGWAHRTRLAAAGSAVLAPVVLAIGVQVQHLVSLSRHDIPDDGTVTMIGPEPFPAVVLWAALVAPLAGYAVRLRRRGRRRQAAWIVVLGSFVALELTAIVAGQLAAAIEGVSFATSAWWFPFSLLGYDDRSTSLPALLGADALAIDIVLTAVAGTMRPLLACTAFAVGYGIRASRASVAEVLRAPVSVPPARSAATAGAAWVVPGPAFRTFGLAVIAFGLALWAYVSTVLTPGLVEVAAVDEVQSWELHLWAQELREAAIVLAVLGLLVSAAGRGPVLLPGLFVATALLVADSMIDRFDLGGLSLLPGVFGLGVAVLAVGWGLSGVLAGDRNDSRVSEPVVRRRLAWVSVVAALCGPALFARTWSDSIMPMGYPASTAIAVGAFAAVAVLAAVAVRPGRLPKTARALLVGGPALLMGTLGALLGTVAVAFVGAGLGLLLVALTLAIMTLRSGRWVTLRWSAVGLVALLLGLPVAFAQIVLGSLVGHWLFAAAGYGTPVDGLPALPGAVIIAVPLAVLLAWRVVPRPTPSLM
ncbi:hypothetical protein ACWDV4_26580 [Micromonospora sp. NPDC003197]